MQVSVSAQTFEMLWDWSLESEIVEQIVHDLAWDEEHGSNETVEESFTVTPNSIPSLMMDALELDAQADVQLFKASDVQFITTVHDYFAIHDANKHQYWLDNLVKVMNEQSGEYWLQLWVQWNIIAQVFGFISDQLEVQQEHWAAFWTQHYDIVYRNGYATFTQINYKTVNMVNVYRNWTPIHVCDFTRCRSFTLPADVDDEFTLYMSSIHYGTTWKVDSVQVR